MYTTHVHDVSADKKDSDELLKLVLENIVWCEDVLKVRIIAWCTDAGGDCRAMRRKLLEKRPDLIAPDCWAHQVCGFSYYLAQVDGHG